jgi:hypothetical protein
LLSDLSSLLGFGTTFPLVGSPSFLDSPTFALYLPSLSHTSHPTLTRSALAVQTKRALTLQPTFFSTNSSFLFPLVAATLPYFPSAVNTHLPTYLPILPSHATPSTMTHAATHSSEEPYRGPKLSALARRIHGWSFQSFPIGYASSLHLVAYQNHYLTSGCDFRFLWAGDRPGWGPERFTSPCRTSRTIRTF